MFRHAGAEDAQRSDAGDAAAGAETRTLCGALDPHRPRRVPRLAADRWAKAFGAGPWDLRRGLQPASSTPGAPAAIARCTIPMATGSRSEEHTSELQSQSNLVCRLLLEKKKK